MSRGSASIEIDIDDQMVIIKVEELDAELNPVIDPETGTPVLAELAIRPEMAREVAFRLSLAALKIETSD